jgi:two-component system heavy metal sensor histidine kinase CusS
MTLRRRTFLLVSAALALTLLFSLALVDTLVGRALRTQLDSALLTHARTEAASSFDRPGGQAHVHDAPVESSSGALTKYAAIYDLQTGALLVATRTFVEPPPLDPRARAACARGQELLTYLWLRGGGAQEGRRHLRGVWVPAPERHNPRAVVLLAVPDEMVTQVHAWLRSSALFTALLGLVLSFLVARLLARRLTRGTEAIAATARGVAAGDLSRRVDLAIPDEEIAGLAQDLNDMIDRLSRLLQAQRRFTSDAAHELRSPLTALRGQLEVALRRPREGPEYRACLESCLDDVERLCALAEDLLALARLEGRPTRGQDPVPLREVVRQTLLGLSEPAGMAGVSLKLLPGPRVEVQGDGLQLGRLLRNLVENAVRASPPGGEVEVEVTPQGDQVLLLVMDRGPGVTPAMQERIFEPFLRLDAGRARSQGGAGLGLAIAREIARVHGGDLHYRDRPGGGALFMATLAIPLGRS